MSIESGSLLHTERAPKAVQWEVVEALVEEGMVRIQWDATTPDGLASGADLVGACEALLDCNAFTDRYAIEVPPDRADVGFHRFAMNDVEGGHRSYREGVHRGLPLSGIWNHRALSNPRWPELEHSQRVFDRISERYTQVLGAISRAFGATVDPDGTVGGLVGANGRHDGSYLRVVASPGAPDAGVLEVNPSTQLVCRHRPHVDTTVFVIQPPILEATRRGGRLHHHVAGRWIPLEVSPGEIVVFTGSDFNEVTKPLHSARFVHQVLSTVEEARQDRLSVFFRAGVDPAAPILRNVDGSQFRFRSGQAAPSGHDYYSGMVAYRAS